MYSIINFTFGGGIFRRCACRSLTFIETWVRFFQNLPSDNKVLNEIDIPGQVL